MKTNLDSLFATDTNLEETGVWLKISEGIRFRVSRFGGKNTQKLKVAMAKWHKPKARLIEMGNLAPSETQEIFMKVFIESCLIEWEGVELDGQLVECNFDNALKLFKKLPQLFEALWQHSQDFESYKEDLGNS